MSGTQEATPVTVAIVIIQPVTVQQGQRSYTAPGGSVVSVRQVMVSRAAQVLGLQQHERVIEGAGLKVGEVIDPAVLPGLITVGVAGIAQPTPPDPLAFLNNLSPELLQPAATRIKALAAAASVTLSAQQPASPGLAQATVSLAR